MELKSIKEEVTPLLQPNRENPPLSSTDAKVHSFAKRCFDSLSLAITTIFSFIWTVITTPFTRIINLVNKVFDPEPSEEEADPLIPGQPIGLNNQGNDCWLNSSLQFIANLPEYERILQAIIEASNEPITEEKESKERAKAAKDMLSFCNAVKTYQNDQEKGLRISTLDTHILRQQLRTFLVDISEQGQEDPSTLFECIFATCVTCKIHETGLPITQKIRLYAKTDPTTSLEESEREWLANEVSIIALQLDPTSKPFAFKTLWSSFFKIIAPPPNEDLTKEQEIALSFTRAPDAFTVKLSRFLILKDEAGKAVLDKDGVLVSRKMNDRIDVPLQITLTEEECPSHPGATYNCDGIIVHAGNLNGGHYIAYIYKEANWWGLNDASSTVMSVEEIQEIAKDGYFFHYTKLST